MSINKQIILHLCILSAVLCLFEFTNMDIALQDHFYQWDSRQWIVDKNDPVLRFLFYTGLKGLIIAFGILCLFGFLLSLKVTKLKPYRRGFLLICLALIMAPETAAILKKVSNVYTPYETRRYGGEQPYVRVLERYPPDFKQTMRGEGWPAGHASGGFALMILYYAFHRKRYRRLGLFIGLSMGWTMGLYQMFKGAHYLSHTLITMSMAWIWVLIIHWVIRSEFPAMALQRFRKYVPTSPGRREAPFFSRAGKRSYS